MSLINIKEHTKEVVKLPDGKVIGYIENHTFIKEVRASKHRLRCPPTWAIDFWQGKRDAIPTKVQAKCRVCQHKGLCEFSLAN